MNIVKIVEEEYAAYAAEVAASAAYMGREPHVINSFELMNNAVNLAYFCRKVFQSYGVVRYSHLRQIDLRIDGILSAWAEMTAYGPAEFKVRLEEFRSLVLDSIKE